MEYWGCVWAVLFFRTICFFIFITITKYSLWFITLIFLFFPHHDFFEEINSINLINSINSILLLMVMVTRTIFCLRSYFLVSLLLILAYLIPFFYFWPAPNSTKFFTNPIFISGYWPKAEESGWRLEIYWATGC